MNFKRFLIAISNNIFNKNKFICFFSILLISSIYDSNAQSIPVKLERRLIKDLNSLFETIKIQSSLRTAGSDTSLVNYSKSIMKGIKGFKLNTYNDPKDITYSKSIKKGRKEITVYISFSTNSLNPSQFYLSHSIYYLPNIDLDKFYTNALMINSGNRIGTLCGGAKIYTNPLLPGYISLNYNSFSSGRPYMIFFPNDFISENNWSLWDNRRKIPFREKIIIDSLPTLKGFKTINDDIKGSNKFILTSSSNDFARYRLSFFELVKKEYDEYIRNNIDSLKSNPNVDEFLSKIDSLQTNKMKELNILWFTVGVNRAEPLGNSNIKNISFSIYLYFMPKDRHQEIKELSNKLFFCLNEANLNDIVPPVSEIFNQIEIDTLAGNTYEKTTGNYRIVAKKNEPFNRGHWQFTISIGACD